MQMGEEKDCTTFNVRMAVIVGLRNIENGVLNESILAVEQGVLEALHGP
jgi:hypothetical protein